MLRQQAIEDLFMRLLSGQSNPFMFDVSPFLINNSMEQSLPAAPNRNVPGGESSGGVSRGTATETSVPLTPPTTTVGFAGASAPNRMPRNPGNNASPIRNPMPVREQRPGFSGADFFRLAGLF